MNDIPHGFELVWDVSLRDAFALAKSLEHAGQLAQNLTGHITPDGHAMAQDTDCSVPLRSRRSTAKPPLSLQIQETIRTTTLRAGLPTGRSNKTGSTYSSAWTEFSYEQ